MHTVTNKNNNINDNKNIDSINSSNPTMYAETNGISAKSRRTNNRNNNNANVEDSSSSSQQSNAVGMISGHRPTVQQYIQQLRQKDEKIHSLEEENKKLRSMLVSKSNECQGRVDELVKELERHAELVAQLQNELKKNAMGTAAVVVKPQNNGNNKRSRNKVHHQPALSAASGSAIVVGTTLNGTTNSHSSLANETTKNMANSEDVYAKLANFVETNQPEPPTTNIEVQMNAATSQQQSDEALMAEQMFQLMAENPSLLPAFILSTTAAGIDGMNNMNEANNDKLEPEAANLLNMFLESTAMLDANNGTPAVGDFVMDNQQQQNMDFEEVMQCVIGKAMNNAAAGEMSNPINNGIMPCPTPPVSSSIAFGNHEEKMAGATPSSKNVKHKKKKKASVGFTGTSTALSSPISKKKTSITFANKKDNNNSHHISKSVVGANAISSPVLLSNYTPPPPTSNIQHHHYLHQPNSSSSSAKLFSPEEQKLANELDARIDQNIVQLGNQTLNTAELALQCTRLMREYSIGQRLFARTVMCKVSQSQGSLSELLSKPRPWPKLTDKGRDAFRRIFGWISDDVAIELLCQLSPRKVAIAEKIVHPDPSTLLGQPLSDEVEESAMMDVMDNTTNKMEMPAALLLKKELTPRHSSFSSSVSTEFPIQNKIETEKMEAADCGVEQMPTLATKQLKSQQQQQLASTMVAGTNREAAAMPSNSSNSNGRWRHDDIPKEKIIDIYEMEKAKLLEQESHLGPTVDGTTAPLGLIPPYSVGMANMKTRQTSAEANKLREKQQQQMCSPSSRYVAVHPSSVHSTSVSSVDQKSSGGSRLTMEQQTFQITDSNLERYHKALNTEEVVQRVKEFLAKNGISQRHFGETVLGLSQGSVSDLLARPKAWNLLTQKGREPFIRMQIFLEQKERMMEGEEKMEMENGGEEENNNNRCGDIQKMGTTTQIEAEELDEDDDDGEELQLTLELPPDSSPEPTEVNEEGGEEKEEKEKGSERSEIDDNLVAAAERDEDSEKFLQNVLAYIKSEQATEEAEKPMELGKRQQQQQRKKGNMSIGISNHQQKTTATTTTKQQQQPTTTLRTNNSGEIDTVDVARRVKECLARNNISQRAFGQHVLNITSGCVSDLLAKPKPWVMVGWKQQTCYTKMLDFLSDPGAVEQLRSDELRRCELNNALNALKAITAISSSTTAESNNNSGSSNLLAGLSTNIDHQQQQEHHSPIVDSIESSSCPSTLQVVTNLANELGANTPIGTILKKANSPKPPTTMALTNGVAIGVGAQQQKHQQLIGRSSPLPNKRKGTPSSISSSFGMMTNAAVKMLSMVAADDVGGPPLKKCPRFQRTVITEKQKEALLFIFAHEQRPNSRCIEQLAAKLGLTPRTVTNWFHNYRTRQKAKEAKDVDDFVQAQPSGSTPAQILARALNATDAKTTKWFKELAELLRNYSEIPVDVNGIGAPRGSVGTASAESSPPFQRANVNDDEEFDDEFARQIGSKNGTGLWGASSPQHQNISSNTGASQLDRVIARLMAGKAQ